MADDTRPNSGSTPPSPAPVPAPTAAPTSTPPRPAAAVESSPSDARCDALPPFRVLLHNDDHNDMTYVLETIMDLTPLEPPVATKVMLEAHKTGIALVLTTHKERAELYQDQFNSKGLIVTIEPA